MGSKLQPGKFDCFAAAMPDEPMFILLARDRSAPAMLRAWATRRRGEVLDAHERGEVGADKMEEDLRKCTEADTCADEMTVWRRRNAGDSESGIPHAWHDNLEARKAVPEPTPADLVEVERATIAALGQWLGIPSQFWTGAFTIMDQTWRAWDSPFFRGRVHRVSVRTVGRFGDTSRTDLPYDLFAVQGETVADVSAVVMDENDIMITLHTVLD